MADGEGLSGRVHFTETHEQDRPMWLYAGVDVFVLPSRYENFGNVVAEAAAAGIPSVVTDRCGVAEYVRDRAALVVECTAQAIRGGITRILTESELRTSLAAQGPRVAAELSWANVAATQEDIYRRALARR